MKTKMQDRRKPENYKLRVYMDAMQDAKAMTDEQWLDAWIKNADTNSPYVFREQFIAYIDQCILGEVTKLLERESA